jgi:hypothetical protein
MPLQNTQSPGPCYQCGKNVTAKVLRCIVCQKNLAHPECAPNEYTIEGNGVKWTCRTCVLQKTSSSSGTQLGSSKPLTQADLSAFEGRLMSRFDDLVSRITTVEKSLGFLSDQYDTLVKEVESHKTLFKELKQGLAEAKKRDEEKTRVVNQLSARVNQLEQASLSRNLEIIDLPLTGESEQHLRSDLQKLATEIGAPNVADTVEDLYLVRAKPESTTARARPAKVVVRLKNDSSKVEWLAARRRLNQQQRRAPGAEEQQRDNGGQPGAPAPSFASAAGGPQGRSKPIRIYEMLTPYNKRLLFLAKEAGRAQGFQYVWPKQGKIFVRHSEQLGQVIRITCEDDIRQKMHHNVTTAHI